MVDYGNAYVAPGLQYFYDKFSGELSESVAAFKVARLVSPQKMVEIQPNAQDKDAMKCFPFLKGTVIDNLKQELPVYLAKAENLMKPLTLFSGGRGTQKICHIGPLLLRRYY